MSTRFAAERPDRPEVEVRVAGQAVEQAVQADVIEVDVGEEVGRHARCALLLQNWDADTGTVRWSDDGPFAPGAEVEVLLGYHSDLTSVFDGVVTALTAHFPTERPPVLRVEARSRSVVLSRPARSRVLVDVSDGDVARAVAADHGLDVDAEDGATRPFVVLDGRGDWDLLAARAADLGWVAYVRGSTLVFRPPAPVQDPLTLEWTLNLTELHLTQDVTAPASAVTVTAWDPAAQETVEAEADAARAGIDVGERDDHTAAVEGTGWAGREARAGSPLPRTAEEVDLLAVGAARGAALRHVSGIGRTVGTPTLRCDAWVDLVGVGSRFSGPHYVSAVRHRLSRRGCTTEFQVGLPAPLVPPGASAGVGGAVVGGGGAGVTGGSGAGGGLVLGVVEDLDDPEAWGRVKVGLPWRTDAPDAVWARLATLDAGPEQGTFFIPDVGQEVLVGFLAGDPASPVVLGSLWNGQAAPPLAVDSGNPVRAIVTRSGHTLTFDDGDPGSVTLATAGGRTAVLDDGDASVTLSESDGGNSIRLSGDGIEITAASGDLTLSASSGAVTIEALRFSAKAQSTAALECTASLDLKASATLALSGALVQIN